MPHCQILGVPLHQGQRRSGVERAPHYLRTAGLLPALRSVCGWSLTDRGDLNIFTYPDDPWRAVGAAARQVYEQCLNPTDLSLVLGGDHSLAIGTIAAALQLRPNTHVVYVDAHADLNTPSTTPTGNLHGMVLALLMDLENMRSIPGFEWLTYYQVPILQPDQLTYLALRDAGTSEQQTINRNGISVYTVADLARYGLGDLLAETTDQPIHLSFDVDAIDPRYLPSTGTPVAQGLNVGTALAICSELAATGRLRSLDLVELNPAINPSGATRSAQIAIDLCVTVLRESVN
jgi:arginase